MQGCEGCAVREATLCAAVEGDFDVLEHLRDGGRRIAAGADLFSQGRVANRFYVVVEGWLCTYELMEDGRRQVLGFALPGDIVGLPCDAPLAFAAMAVTEAAVCAIPLDRFRNACHARPELALALSRLLSSDRQLAYGHMTSLGRRSAQERVAHLLLELFWRLRSRMPTIAGDRIGLPLTQALIADALGLTPVHTNRMLQQLRKDGIVRLSRGLLHVTDPDRLVVAAGLEAGCMAAAPPFGPGVLGPPEAGRAMPMGRAV